MRSKTRILGAAALTAMIAVVAQVSLATGADISDARDDEAAGKLNSAIANCNKSEDDRFAAQQAQFQRERQRNQELLKQSETQTEAMRRQYDDLRGSYVLLEAQNDDTRKQNQELQQKYAEMQQKLEEAQAKYEDVLKASQPAKPPEESKGDDTLHKVLGIFK